MSGSQGSAIVVSRSDACGIVEFARPEKRNALRPVDWEGLEQAVTRLSQEATTKVIILSGRGGAFSAGFDLNATAAPGGPRTIPGVHRALLAIHRSPKVTLAAVEGACVGAAWALALACDLVVAGEGAFFQPPWVARGLMPDAGIAWLLARRIGPQEIARLIFLEGRYEAGDAKSRGLVAEVVAAGGALSRSLELGERLGGLPGSTVAVAKSALHRSNAPTLEAGLEGEEFEVALNAALPDSAEARAQFMARLGRPGGG